jgi:hypothetical protein
MPTSSPGRSGSAHRVYRWRAGSKVSYRRRSKDPSPLWFGLGTPFLPTGPLQSGLPAIHRPQALDGFNKSECFARTVRPEEERSRHVCAE